MNLFWLGISGVALGLSGLNAYLYLQASKSFNVGIIWVVEANSQFNILNYIPGDVRDKAMKYLFTVKVKNRTIQSSIVNAVSSAATNLV